MDVPAPSASIPDFNLERANALADSATANDHEAALPIFLLLRYLVDPNGDPVRFSIADEVMKRLIVKTPQFEEWFRSQVA